MIIRRWIAPLSPSKHQIQTVFEQDGLKYFEEDFDSETEIPKHRHPFDEVRTIVKGEILYNISGNKVLLRSGDKIIIPSNTWHSKSVRKDSFCFSICAYQAY